MYIAVIADDIARRKHMERLLDRTSDAIVSQTGNLYIEAYGDPESIWSSIKRYDLFFVDIHQDDSLRELVVNRLLELNLNSQTIICQPQDEAISSWPLEQGFLTMQHPLSIKSLSNIICESYQILEQKSKQQQIIELRCGDMTDYVEVSKILYACKKNHLVEVVLLDGSTKEMLGSILDFYRQVEIFPEFTMHKKEVVVNNHHVKKIKGRTITLLNDQTIKLPLFTSHLFLK